MSLLSPSTVPLGSWARHRHHVRLAAGVGVALLLASTVVSPASAGTPTVGTGRVATWTGQGVGTDDSGAPAFRTTVCNSSYDPYVTFVLAGTAARTATITIDGTARPMQKSRSGKDTAAWRYTYEPAAEGPMDIAALVASNVTVTYDGKDIGTLTAGSGCGGQSPDVAGTASKLALGMRHVCAMSATGSVKCWGYNAYGQLGIGTYYGKGASSSDMGVNLPAVDLGTGRSARAIVAGKLFTCALLDNATVKCWGDNQYGQLATGDNNPRGTGPGEMGDNLLPISFGGGHTVKQIAAGDEEACAILDDDTVRCWGRSVQGSLGQGYLDVGGASNPVSGLAPVNLGTGLTAKGISVGKYHVCVILHSATNDAAFENQVKCWGYNMYGQLGIGSGNPKGENGNGMGDALPVVALGAGRSAKAITTGFDHSCALLDDNTVKCWGNNADGQLGLGSNVSIRGGFSDAMGDTLPAVDLGSGRTAKSIEAAWAGTCAVLDNDSVKCWGENSNGTLGVGNTTTYGLTSATMGTGLPAVDLGTGRTAKAVQAGWAHVCAILDSDFVKCWGNNDFGQLGLGDQYNRGDGGVNGAMGDALLVVDF